MKRKLWLYPPEPKPSAEYLSAIYPLKKDSHNCFHQIQFFFLCLCWTVQGQTVKEHHTCASGRQHQSACSQWCPSWQPKQENTRGKKEGLSFICPSFTGWLNEVKHVFCCPFYSEVEQILSWTVCKLCLHVRGQHSLCWGAQQGTYFSFLFVSGQM